MIEARKFLFVLVLSAPLAAHAGAGEAVSSFSAGRAALEAQDPIAARAAFAKARDEAPTWLLPRLELAAIAVSRRESLEEARASLLEVVPGNERNPRLHRLLGEIAELVGDDAGLADALGRSLALLPDQPGLRARRAAALWRLGRFPEAADEYAQAVRSQPGDLHLRARLADALESASRLDEAREQLQELVKRQPTEEIPLRRLARFYERQGAVAEARSAHARADKVAESRRPTRKLRPLLPSKR